MAADSGPSGRTEDVVIEFAQAEPAPELVAGIEYELVGAFYS